MPKIAKCCVSLVTEENQVSKMKRVLEYHLPGESLVSTCSLEEYIRRAERRGDEEYKIQTSDGFVVYERLFKHNPDDTKSDIKTNNKSVDNCINFLAHDKAIEALNC